MNIRLQGLLSILLLSLAHSVHALTILPDGPEQAPVIYVHGYTDDGTSWARDNLNMVEVEIRPLSYKHLRAYVLGPSRSPSAFFTRNGIENWALQWWADDGFNTYSTADEGYAFLQDASQLLAGTDWINGTWTAQNRPIPSALNVLLSTEIDMALNLSSIPAYVLGLPSSFLVKAGIASQLAIKSTYQDSGRVDPRAENLLDLLRTERRDGGKLSRYRQVNIITHSMGSLVTRAMLDKAFNASEQDSEFVANVVYNAPPFAGSTMAHLAKIYFEPVTLDSTIFADERVQIMLSTSADTAKGVLTNFIDLLIQPAGMRYQDMESALNPLVRSTIDSLQLIPITQTISPQYIQSLSGLPIGDAIVAVMQFVRPFVAGLLGVKGIPGVDDLTPEGGFAHITTYTTNPDVKQFVTVGTHGVSIHLFPNDLDAVANDPTLITNNSALSAQVDDTAVAVGSAKLLTTTDNFGPRMTLLGEFSNDHLGMLHHIPVMGPVWLETLLAPSTRMQVSGDVQVISSADRNYLVRDAAASFFFESDTIDRTLDFPVTPILPLGKSVDISISATSYEYRLVSDDGATVINDWVNVFPGERIEFGTLVSSNTLENKPFYLEWRSVNQRGGREMIRSARFVVAGAAPQLLQANILAANPQQVAKVRRNELIGNKAVRGRAFGRLLTPAEITQLTALSAQSEANWIVSQPQGKALTLGFDTRGNVEYAWNDSSMQSAQAFSNVAGVLIELDGFSEGVHILYFHTANPLTPQQFSPLQKVRVQVDNTAPRLNFELQKNHPLGVVIGPMTPLYFTVEDYGSNAASGELTVAGNPGGTFPSGETFSLQQTGLRQQMETAGIAGGELQLTLSATDRVGNTRSEIHTVYYDISPPEINVLQITPVLQPAGGADTDYQLYAEKVDLVIDIKDAGSGVTGNTPVLLIAGEQGGYQMSQDLVLGGIAGYPDKYGASIALPPGRNRLTIAINDFAGNTGELGINIERIDPAVQDVAIDILSPRIDGNTCYNAQGNLVSCTSGAIDLFTVSHDGERVAFSSSGNNFVGGDSNRSRDIFIWDGSALKIASRSATGELADDDSKNPVLSGNGRYLLFESSASNLVTGAQDFNFYVKDLETGRIDVVSRAPDNTPINLSSFGNFSASTTYSGRYVFFSSRRNATYLSAFVNPGTQVYMVDLDPDANGDYFDNNYVTYPVSNINANTMPASASEYPKVSLDGRYLVYRSRTDGGLKLLRLSGSDATGDLDVSVRSEVVIPGSSSTSVFDIAPFSDDVAFLSTRNLLPADTNQELVDSDIYLSRGEASGADFFTRSLELVSSSFDGLASDMDAAFPLQDVSVAQDRLSAATDVKVAWVSSHTKIVSGDTKGFEDLFVSRNSSTYPTGLAVPNWINDSLPSGATVRTGALSTDGRYAFWVSQQTYATPFASDGTLHLYRRRIDAPQTTTLNVKIQGSGAVNVFPRGTEISPGVYQFNNEEPVSLTALADSGYELSSWQGDVTGTGAGNKIVMDTGRAVTAVFTAIPGPISASADIQAVQGRKTSGLAPSITANGNQEFVISIVTQPTYGTASALGGLLFYEPQGDYVGPDSFEFQVTNGRGAHLPVAAIANVQVNALNRAPLTSSLQISATENQASTPISAQVNDPDAGDVFSFAVVIQPANGQVNVQNNQFIYTPNTGYVGEDTFSYSVTDSAGNTLTALAKVTVVASASPAPTDNTSSGGGGGGAMGSELWFALLLLWSHYFLYTRRRYD